MPAGLWHIPAVLAPALAAKVNVAGCCGSLIYLPRSSNN